MEITVITFFQFKKIIIFARLIKKKKDNDNEDQSNFNDDTCVEDNSFLLDETATKSANDFIMKIYKRQ